MSLSPLPSRQRLYQLGLVVGLALFGYQSWRALQATRSAGFCIGEPRWLALALLIYVLCTIVQIGAWQRSMHYVAASIRPAPAIRGYVLSFLPRYVPGTIWGYLSRNEWLAQKHSIPYATSSTASLLEVILQLSTVGLITLLYWAPPAWRWVFGAGVLVVAFIAWTQLPTLVRRVPTLNLRFDGKTHGPLSTFLSAMAFYLIFWSLHGAALVCLGNAFCQPLHLSWKAATAAMTMAWAAGFLTVITPTGLGVRELTLSTLLTTSTDVAGGAAALLAVLSRGLLLAAELVLILAVLPITWQRRGTH